MLLYGRVFLSLESRGCARRCSAATPEIEHVLCSQVRLLHKPVYSLSEVQNDIWQQAAWHATAHFQVGQVLVFYVDSDYTYSNVRYTELQQFRRSAFGQLLAARCRAAEAIFNRHQ